MHATVDNTAVRRRRAMSALLSVRRKAGLAIGLVLAITACVPQAAAPGSTTSKQCGQSSAKEAPIDLQTAINDFVQSVPAADTSGYADPKRDPEGVNAFIQGFANVAAGDLTAACRALAPVAYRAVLTTDSKTGRDVVLLLETRGQNGYARAWGMYIVSWPPTVNPSTLIVEVPHACPHTVETGCGEGDRFTHLVAVKVFQDANARYLFINGADRRANGDFGPDECENDSRCADVAHQPESPFERIHEKAADGLGSSVKIYQSHRFLSRRHLDLKDNVPPTSEVANVVVSTGTMSPSPLAEDVAGGIERAESSFFHVCIFNASDDCSKLGATKNVQRKHSPEGRFIHVEASDDVVRDSCGTPCRRDELATAIAAVMK